MEMEEKKNQSLQDSQEAPKGFEDEQEDDMIIPRVKIVQTLSPERKEGEADEGDIINSLTKEKLNDKVFVPVFKFNNNIEWIPRDEGGGIACSARDGKHGVTADGEELLCKQCKRNEFDNTKKGKEAIPKCTKYINFFGFMSGERIPIILSFAKTNFKEGKKMYSIAKVSMQNMWNNGYKLNEKKVAKNGNEWFIITATPAGPTDEEDRQFAVELYKNFRDKALAYDMGEEGKDEAGGASDEEVESSEF